MKIVMALDHRTYSGTPIEIVRKLRAEAIHMKTRDTDAYMRAVVARLRAEQHAEIDLSGADLEERCESFLAGVIRAGMATPVFQRDRVDATAIRILRRARDLTQERLASLLQVSFATVNRWESSEHLPSSANTLRGLEEELFIYFSQPAERSSGLAPLTGALQRARERARSRFRPPAHSGNDSIAARNVLKP
jgi:transcriptional regulator with XRE-family HTH domain